jgi:two-component sensor histidine kinase
MALSTSELPQARTVNAATIADVKNRPSDLFITAAALPRHTVPPNPQAEAVAFRELSKVLADDPSLALRHLLEIARHLCDAGTAGLSLLRHDQAGQPIVHWEAVSGALASYEGTDTPRGGSPCGLCLDAGATIVVSRPERAFTSLHDTRPSIVEDLIVPLYDGMSKPLGTLWVARHAGTSHFSADDARIVEQLGVQLVLTLRLVEQARERVHAWALLVSHQVAQQNLPAGDLYQERRRHEQVERASREALLFKDALIQEVNHRTKNTLQAAASLLCLHARTTSSEQVREALHDSRQRLQLLAHAHELLFSNPGSTQTILMPSLLQTLGDALRQSFANASAQVRLELASDAIALPADVAIPIVLFANEAVTNAYKHAFPSDSAGTITMELRCMPENVLVLRIADSGVGLGSSGREGGLGLKLIRILAAQLRGALDFAQPTDSGGTAITLTIDHPAPRKHLPVVDSSASVA